MHPSQYRAAINKAIAPYNLKIEAARCGNRLLGYSYFVDTKTGIQVGSSVMVYRQYELTLARWVSLAKQTREEARR